MNPWTLPAPFDFIVWCAAWAGHAIWWWGSTTTRNVATLGPAWVVAYWLAVALGFKVGAWGNQAMRQVRKGADAWEYSPDRKGGAWIGWAVKPIRLQIKAEDWAASSATVGGYAAAWGLLAVGLVWRWFAIAIGLWAFAKALETRRRRRAWWS